MQLTILLETALISLARASLFLGSRKYLINSLYHDLQDISSVSSGIDSVEMDALPTPSTATQQSFQPKQSLARRAFHSKLSRTIFSISFSESCILFVLLMCQGLDIFSSRTRLLNWQISLTAVLASILVVIPLSYSLVLSYRTSEGPQSIHRPSLFRTLITALPVGLFLFALSFVPLPSAVLPTSSFSSKVLSRLVVVGIVILSSLSGFGAATNIWTFLVRSSGGHRSPAEDDIQSAERSLQRIRNDLSERRRTVASLDHPENGGTWFNKMIPNFRGGSQLSDAMQEISGLEALEYQMERNLEQLRLRRSEAQFSRTLYGRLFNAFGKIFAIYCIYRIITSSLNVFIPIRTPVLTEAPSNASSARPDYVTTGLAYLVGLWPSVEISKEQIAVISRQISLGLVGVIILSSIRLVLRGVARMLRVTSRNLGASLMLLIIAQLMGLYLLSTLIQLRTSFPPPPSRSDIEPDDGTINLFSTLPEYQFFGVLFDQFFFVSAVVGGVGPWIIERVSGGAVVE